MQLEKILDEIVGDNPGTEGSFVSYRKLKDCVRHIIERRSLREATVARVPSSGEAGTSQHLHTMGSGAASDISSAGALQGVSSGSGSSDPRDDLREEFLTTLRSDVARLNARFIEREEDLVIAAQAARESLQKASAGSAEAASRARRLAEVHLEAAKEVHWALLNTLALMRISRSLDRALGVLVSDIKGSVIRALQGSIPKQPFRSTPVMTQLVTDAESALVPRITAELPASHAPPSVSTRGGSPEPISSATFAWADLAQDWATGIRDLVAHFAILEDFSPEAAAMARRLQGVLPTLGDGAGRGSSALGGSPEIHPRAGLPPHRRLKASTSDVSADTPPEEGGSVRGDSADTGRRSPGTKGSGSGSGKGSQEGPGARQVAPSPGAVATRGATPTVPSASARPRSAPGDAGDDGRPSKRPFTGAGDS